MKFIGVNQVTLPLPFRLDHVHCYLVKGENGWTIVDSGIHTEETREAWERAFLTYNINPYKDIEKIVLTHYHPDHFGFAGVLQEWTGACVHMSKGGEMLARSTWTEERYRENRKFYCKNGLPDRINEELAENDQIYFSRVRPFPSKIKIIDGDSIMLGGLSFEVITTPGHAEGHLCFYQSEKRILFAGDSLLKKITPNISYHGYGEWNPLASFFQTLEKLKGLDVAVALPGHGPIFQDVDTRIEELMVHHELRLEQILGLIESKCTAWEICKKLFHRELSTHEIRFAMGETVAHLNYLQEKGRIDQEVDSKGTIFYVR